MKIWPRKFGFSELVLVPVFWFGTGSKYDHENCPPPPVLWHKLTAQKTLRTCLCVYACSIYILRPGKKGTGGKAKDIPNTLYIIDKIGNTFARGHLTVQYSQHVRQNMFNGVRITEH